MKLSEKMKSGGSQGRPDITWSVSRVNATIDIWLKEVAKLEAENERLRNRDANTCCLCNERTTRISFRLGYGSSHDGAYVCWGCAPKFDVVFSGDNK